MMVQVVYIWIGTAIYFLSCSETIPWITNQCVKTVDGSDCSGLALQRVPDDIPDFIKTLDFSFNYLPTLYSSTFQRLRSLVTLDLTRCSIHSIYEDVFRHQLELETLILVSNPLNFMSDSAFSGPLALKYVSLAGSMISSLMDIPTSNLESLETLDLKGSEINSLYGLGNFPLQQMKRLVLDMNLIERITMADMEKFQGSSDLEISFKGNNLVDVEPHAFQNLDLSSLAFTGCFNQMNISVLLKGLEGVKTTKLYLGLYEDSRKSYISPVELQSFCNISTTEVHFLLHHLVKLTSMTFRCFGGIQMLDFTRGHISAFPSNLSNMSMLSHLVLDENSFHNICHINAANFPMLTRLSMNRNLKVLDFSENCLEPLSYLEELQLSHSRLTTGDLCCNKQLTGLRELKLLNLSYNSLMMWEPLPFNATPNLKHLDCTNTKYVLNSNSPFNNLKNLLTLNLSFTDYNLLDHADILKGLNKLRVLSLKGNTIQGGVLVKTRNFEYVSFLESLVLSSCGITEISENVFKDLAHLRSVDLSENQLGTLDLTEFSSLNQIQLNFASNKITVVDINVIKGLGTNSSIDLSSNPLACNCTNYQFFTWVKENVSKMKHIETTVCDATDEKIIAIDLQCVFANKTLGIVLGILMVIVFIIALVYFAKKSHRRYRLYLRL